MTNDTAVSPILGTLLALVMLALVCAPVMAFVQPPEVCRIATPQNASPCPDDICLYYNTTCVNEEKLKYSQEYYDAKKLADAHMANGVGWDASNNRYLENIFYELRRQTILMEKQNELLAEQNELLKNRSFPNYHCDMENPGSYRPYNCIPVIS